MGTTADFVIGSLIIGIAIFLIGSLIPSVDAISTVKVVLINGKLVDMSEFQITPKNLPDCDCIHLHPSSGSSVTARDGTVIPDPAPTKCGYGCVEGFKTGTVRDIPANLDKDRDGLTDTFEMDFTMTDPNNPCSDGKILDGDTDKDNDGLTVNEEIEESTLPNNPDSNGNGIPDGLDVALTKIKKDFYKVPIIINVLKDSMANTANMKMHIDSANEVFMKFNVMFHLIKINDLPDNDGEPGGANNNGIVDDKNEDAKIRESGKSEIESTIQTSEKLKGKGMKITFVKDIKWPSAAVGTASPGNPVIFVKETTPKIDIADTIVHESMHAFGIPTNTGKSPEPEDDGPENPLTITAERRAFIISTDPGMGWKNSKVTDKQKQDMADNIKKWGIPGTGNSPYFLKDWQGGGKVDAIGDQTGGNPGYLDLLGINMESDLLDDKIRILINLGGLYPDLPVDATYSLLFDTDNDQFTGFTVGSFNGIEQEVVIRVTGDASIEPLSVKGIIFDNVNFLDTFLVPSPEISVVEAISLKGGNLNIPVNHQINLEISKSELGFSATDIPVGVMTRDEPDSFSPPFNEIDTAFVLFDGDPFLEFPTLELFTQSAASGDSVTYDIFGLTPNTNFNLELDATVVDSGTTDGNGDFSSSFTFPDVESGMHFLTAIDDAGRFTFNRIDVKADHYLGYKIRETGGTAEFVPLQVDLTDQFGTGTFNVIKPLKLYNPVDKNGEGIIDDETHLVGYRIKHAIGGQDEKQLNVQVQNQFGNIFVNVTKIKLLLVPSLKSTAGPITDPIETQVDHFKCYKVKIDKNAPIQFEQLEVSLVDQFQDKDFIVRKPTLLCNPVDKNGEGINDPDNHLMCYKIVEKNERIWTNNQLGPEVLNLKKVNELCVPSTKNIIP